MLSDKIQFSIKVNFCFVIKIIKFDIRNDFVTGPIKCRISFRFLCNSPSKSCFERQLDRWTQEICCETEYLLKSNRKASMYTFPTRKNPPKYGV